LFLRKQLALFRERDKKAAATTAGDRFVFSKLAGFFDWRKRFSDRQTGHRDRLASRCIPPILALEIETGRAATSKGGNERECQNWRPTFPRANNSRNRRLGRITLRGTAIPVQVL
jgi:hypothetical protein